MRRGKYFNSAEVDFTVTLQTVTPATGHGFDRIGGARQYAIQCVFCATMDNALREYRLASPYCTGLEQYSLVSRLPDSIQAPKTGNASAKDHEIDRQVLNFLLGLKVATVAGHC